MKVYRKLASNVILLEKYKKEIEKICSLYVEKGIERCELELSKTL